MIEEGWSARTETSGTTPTSTPPLSTPPQRVQPEYTVISTVAALKTCLDDMVREMAMPPKSYSQAHLLPKTNVPYAKTQSQSEFLMDPVEVPGALFNVTKCTPEMYVDAEGIDLSRSGELSILIIHVETRSFSHTYLIHVHVIGRQPFTARTTNNAHTLKSILEDNRLPKVLFDCRMDSDALFGQFGVLLGGVIDLQLMCIATKGGGGRHLPGLASCLTWDLANTSDEQQAWVAVVKAKGKQLWNPKLGGSMQKFNDDPLLEDIVNYCVVDAAYLPWLFETYNKDLGNRVSLATLDHLWGNKNLRGSEDEVSSWITRVLEQSRARVQLALNANFGGGTSYNPWYVYDDDDWYDW
ncbi:MAG: hypothetical protein Q9209_007537 [Squamulea sp. 1 TL-2023]